MITKLTGLVLALLLFAHFKHHTRPTLRKGDHRVLDESPPIPSGGGFYGAACTRQQEDIIDHTYSLFESVLGEVEDYYNGWEGGCVRRFQDGIIMLGPESSTAYEVHGEIYHTHSTYPLSWLGWPLTDVTDTRDDQGEYSDFEKGSIYHAYGIGAFEIRGEILIKWKAMDDVRSILGYPISNQYATVDGVGRSNEFQNGWIFWHPDHGAHEIHGPIAKKYTSMSWERSFLGFLTSDEKDLPHFSEAKYNEFENGKIFWHPRVHARATDGSCISGGQVYCRLPDSASFYAESSKGNELDAFRSEISNVAMLETDPKVCEEDAADRYDSELFWFNQAWCSEFVRFVYFQAGIKDIKCGDDWWNPWSGTCPHDFDSVGEISKWFDCMGAYKRRGEITPDTVEVGDYIRLRNDDHSVVAVGVSFDKQRIHIAEGNNGDCTNYRAIPYFHKDGDYLLDDRFEGIGKVRPDFFNT